MNLLFLTQYFPPERGAAQNRISDLACRLASVGHQVTVLTAAPNYPGGQIFEGYRRRLWMSEEKNGVRIIRTWLFVTENKNFLSRILNYLSFSIIACTVGLLTVGRIDVVLVESPPLFVGISGLILSKARRAKFVLNVSDLWPESAVVLGALRNKSMIRLATRIEESLYRRASIVTGQTQGIVSDIRTRVPAAHVVLLTNGVAPEFLTRVSEARLVRNRTREELGFGLKVIAAYTGLHGLAQGLETVIDAAEIVSDHEEILFVLLGEGPEKPKLQSLVASLELRNVKFLPPVQMSRMPEILAAVDISIVPLKKNDLFKGALPSKLFEAVGAGVPVVGALQGEAEKFIADSRGGLVVQPENPAQLAKAIVRLSGDSELRDQLAETGRRYVESNFNRETIAKTLENLLLEITCPSKAPGKAKGAALADGGPSILQSASIKNEND
jgi:glycosyltransferase involved in cell wall biosynthesis